MDSSKREQEIFEYMKAEAKKKGYPPTVREICKALGIKSTSTVHKDLAALEKQGSIRKDPTKPRAIEILDPSFDSYYKPVLESGTLPAEVSNVSRTDIVDIPVVGRIAAGTPILAEQNIDDTFPIPSRMVNKGSSNHFMLVVKGDSMIDAGIYSGDYILVREQKEARNGDVVVAMIDGFESEATVKTFYKEEGHIRLQPENQTMSPIIVKDVTILGLVKGVFRYWN